MLSVLRIQDFRRMALRYGLPGVAVSSPAVENHAKVSE